MNTPHDIAIGTQPLESTMALLLYSNKRVTNDDGSQRGGWWRNPQLGSQQWTIFEKGVSDETIRDLEVILDIDTEILLTQGVAKTIEIEIVDQNKGRVLSEIAITQPDGREFRKVWEF